MVQSLVPVAPPTSSPSLSTTDDHRFALLEELKALINIKATLADARATLPLIGQSLRFVQDPRSSGHGSYRHQEYGGTVTANSGPHALVSDDEGNQLLLTFESTLVAMLSALTFPLAMSHLDVDPLRAALLERVRQDLHSLDVAKRDEWDRQRQGIPSSRGHKNTVQTGTAFGGLTFYDAYRCFREVLRPSVDFMVHTRNRPTLHLPRYSSHAPPRGLVPSRNGTPSSRLPCDDRGDATIRSTIRHVASLGHHAD